MKGEGGYNDNDNPLIVKALDITRSREKSNYSIGDAYQVILSSLPQDRVIFFTRWQRNHVRNSLDKNCRNAIHNCSWSCIVTLSCIETKSSIKLQEESGDLKFKVVGLVSLTWTSCGKETRRLSFEII